MVKGKVDGWGNKVGGGGDGLMIDERTHSSTSTPCCELCHRLFAHRLEQCGLVEVDPRLSGL